MGSLPSILLIDDDPVVNFLNKTIISKAGISAETVVFENVLDALDYLKTMNHNGNDQSKAGIIFLDINMPGLNGWDFLKEYQNLPEVDKKQMKVAMLTSSVNPDDKHKAMNFPEIVGFYNKPLKVDDLQDLIGKHWSATD